LVYITQLCAFDLFPSVCWRFANRHCGKTSSNQSLNSKFLISVGAFQKLRHNHKKKISPRWWY